MAIRNPLNATPTKRSASPPKSGVTSSFQKSSSVSPTWPESGSHRESVRFLGASDADSRAMGAVRFKVFDDDHAACVAALRETLGDGAFEEAWAEGAALSTEDAIACAQRGRGEREAGDRLGIADSYGA